MSYIVYEFSPILELFGTNNITENVAVFYIYIFDFITHFLFIF